MSTRRSESIDFVLDLGRALHVQGASSPEVEHAMALASRRFGLGGEFFATPTSIFASFQAENDSSASGSTTHLLRVVPAGIDLGRRARVDEILLEVVAGKLTADEGRVLLASVRVDRSPYPRWLLLVCSALISASAARFFGLDAFEIALAALAGLAVGTFGMLGELSERMKRIQLPCAAFLAAAIVALASGLRGEPTALQVVVAGVISLLPGLRITTAMIELSVDHLAAGSARFFGSLVALIALLFGAAVGAQIGELFPDTVPIAAIEAARAEVPLWTLYVALLVAPLCFGVLFRTRPRDLPWILLSCTMGLLGTRAGEQFLGPGLEAAMGGLMVGLTSNAYGRLLDRPAVTTMIPGILLLVPGNLGFRSLFNLLEHDVISGVEAAFRVALVGISIVAGLFVANVLVRPRKLDRLEG